MQMVVDVADFSPAQADQLRRAMGSKRSTQKMLELSDALFAGMAKLERPEKRADIPTYVLIPAFTISELKTAFQIGFLIFLPFIVIDLVVATVLMSLGMMMMSPTIISMPFKLLLFVLVDGWALTMGSLANSFAT